MRRFPEIRVGCASAALYHHVYGFHSTGTVVYKGSLSLIQEHTEVMPPFLACVIKVHSAPYQASTTYRIFGKCGDYKFLISPGDVYREACHVEGRWFSKHRTLICCFRMKTPREIYILRGVRKIPRKPLRELTQFERPIEPEQIKAEAVIYRCIRRKQCVKLL